MAGAFRLSSPASCAPTCVVASSRMAWFTFAVRSARAKWWWRSAPFMSPARRGAASSLYWRSRRNSPLDVHHGFLAGAQSTEGAPAHRCCRALPARRPCVGHRTGCCRCRARRSVHAVPADGRAGVSSAATAPGRGDREDLGAGPRPGPSTAPSTRPLARGAAGHRSGGRRDAAAGRVPLGVPPGAGGQRSPGGSSGAAAALGGGGGGRGPTALGADGGVLASRRRGGTGARAGPAGARGPLSSAAAVGAGEADAERAGPAPVLAPASASGWIDASAAGSPRADREALRAHPCPAVLLASLSRNPGPARPLARAGDPAPPGWCRPRKGGRGRERWRGRDRLALARAIGLGRAVVGGLIETRLSPGRSAVSPVWRTTTDRWGVHRRGEAPRAARATPAAGGPEARPSRAPP
jgi:hypothetical protein